MQLIVPMAGRSSRFPNLRPKWMLTHPNGNFMVVQAIKGLPVDQFEGIHFIYLQEHEQQFRFLQGFKANLAKNGLGDKANFIALDAPTKDQPETVLQGILKAGLKGPIFIKDSDNYFEAKIRPENCICFQDLNRVGLIKPKNKSYVTIDSHNNIVNIIEKQVISSSFCVGGYGFKSAEAFVKTLQTLPLDKERYISNVIFQMLLEDQVFKAIEVQQYSDWGTVEDWDNYKRSYSTLFVDLDGTLVKNSSAYLPPYIGETEAIKPNIDILKKLQSTGRVEIIVTTSRPESYRSVTEKQLSDLGLMYKALLMGLQHSKRIIINDYSKTNPYKSCDSINLRRDSDDLKEILRESLGRDYDDLL